MPQTLAQVQAGTSYNTIARTFDMQSRRDTVAADVRFSATDNLDLLLGIKSYGRSGNQPWGIGFAFNNLVEIPLVVDNRETEIATGIEWASHQGMFRVMYEHSKFSQAVPTLTVDNPIHATDWNSTPGTGYDPNGYTNAPRCGVQQDGDGAGQHAGHGELDGHGRSCPAAPRQTRHSTWAPTGRTRRSSPGRPTRSVANANTYARSPNWRTCRASRPPCTSTTSPA